MSTYQPASTPLPDNYTASQDSHIPEILAGVLGGGAVVIGVLIVTSIVIVVAVKCHSRKGSLTINQTGK